MARLGQLDASRAHRYETEGLIDTGAVRSTIPAAVAERLGLFRLRKTDAKYADGRVEEVDRTEAVTVSNNSSLSLIVTLTPTSCMMPWSKLGGVLQVYIKFLH